MAFSPANPCRIRGPSFLSSCRLILRLLHRRRLCRHLLCRCRLRCRRSRHCRCRLRLCPLSPSSPASVFIVVIILVVVACSLSSSSRLCRRHRCLSLWLCRLLLHPLRRLPHRRRLVVAIILCVVVTCIAVDCYLSPSSEGLSLVSAQSASSPSAASFFLPFFYFISSGFASPASSRSVNFLGRNPVSLGLEFSDEQQFRRDHLRFPSDIFQTLLYLLCYCLLVEYFSVLN